jgi:hypothetical protein
MNTTYHPIIGKKIEKTPDKNVRNTVLMEIIEEILTLNISLSLIYILIENLNFSHLNITDIFAIILYIIKTVFLKLSFVITYSFSFIISSNDYLSFSISLSIGISRFKIFFNTFK